MKKYKQFLLFAYILILTLTIQITHAESALNEPVYPFRIVQVSDTQPEDENQLEQITKVSENINQLEPDLVIFPGDITAWGSEQEFRKIKPFLSKIKAPLYLVPGNHDTLCPADDEEKKLSRGLLHEKKISVYRQYCGSESWKLEYADFLFVGLDCTDNWPALTEEKIQWLGKTFSTSKKPYKFLVTHYHQTDISKNSSLNAILIDHGVTGVLHGHDHRISAYQDQNTGRLVFSSGSANHTKNKKYGVMYFDVYKDALVCFWKPVNEEVKPLAVFDLKKTLSAVTRRKEVFKISPSIQELQAQKVVLQWQSDFQSEMTVMLKKKQANSFIEYKCGNESNLCKSIIEDLTPNTEYRYYVAIDTPEFGKVKSHVSSFKTPETNPEN